MKRALRWSLALVLVVLVGIALRWAFFRPDPVPVTVFVVARGRVEDTVTNSRSGTVETRFRSSLSPEIGGRVAELAVREGQQVVAGQTLLRLDDREARAQVSLSQRGLETARATEREACLTAGQAERELERYRRLAADQLVSPETLDQYQNRRDVAAAACDRAEAAVREAAAGLDAARVRLSKTVLVAPFTGVVAEVQTEVGEYVSPSPPGLFLPPVVDLIDPDAIYVSAPLDEVDVGRVRPAQSVRITMDPFPEQEFDGVVARVAPYVEDVEKQSRTFDVEVEFEDEAFARTLLPGISADVEVILDAREGVLRVPSYALIEGNRVLVVREERLIARSVEVGLRNWAFAEIRSGLEEGDQVVVSLDRSEVREGARVRVASETLR